jgi:hypothetical protein
MPRITDLHFVTLIAASALALAACSKKEEAAPEATAPAAAPVAEAAPPAPPKPANVSTFMIGQLSASALRDGTLEFPNDNKIFGVGHTPEDVAALLSAAGQATDKIHLDLDPLLVKSGDRVVAVRHGRGFELRADRRAAAAVAAGSRRRCAKRHGHLHLARAMAIMWAAS